MIKDKLKIDSMTALKSGDRQRAEVLRFLISLIDKKEINMPVGSMDEKEELVVLRKELKNKQESREMFAKAGRDDLVAQLDYETEVLKLYLPAEIKIEEIEKTVDEVIGEKGLVFGMVMGETMKRLGGRAGGDVVSEIVKRKISEST